MSTRRIVGLGLSVVDHLYLVESLDLHSTRTRWLERRVSTGGMACNATVQAAALGCNSHFVSALGDDPEGRFLRRELASAGVKTRHTVLAPELSTTVASTVRSMMRDETILLAHYRPTAKAGRPRKRA